MTYVLLTHLKEPKDQAWGFRLNQNVSARARVLPETVLNSPEARRLLNQFNRKVSFQIKFEKKKAWLRLDESTEWTSVLDLEEAHHEQINQFLETAQKCQKVFQDISETRSAQELDEKAKKQSYAFNESKSVRVLNRVKTFASNNLSPSSDLMSTAANTMAVANDTILVGTPLARTVGNLLSVLTLLRGFFLTFVGLRWTAKSLKQLHRAYRVKDEEGGALATMNTAGGVGLSTLGLNMAGVAALGGAATVGGYVMYVTTLIYSLHGLVTNGIFQYRLHQLSQSENALQESFIWLKDQIIDEDKNAIERNLDRLERRIGPKCCQMLREMLAQDPELSELQNNSEAATKLLAEMRVANRKQMVTHAILFIISILGIAAMTACPVAAAALFAIGAVLWLFFDLSAANKWITHKLCPDPDPTMSISQFETWDAFKVSCAAK